MQIESGDVDIEDEVISTAWESRRNEEIKRLEYPTFTKEEGKQASRAHLLTELSHKLH